MFAAFKSAVFSVYVIDNYDSFTYNLVHLVEQLDVPVLVAKNDQVDMAAIRKASHILISPGPGLPSEAGKTMEVIQAFRDSKPMLGVCLGMQAILEHSDATMENMPIVQHGAKSLMQVNEETMLFRGLEKGFHAGRYHSWAFKSQDVPKEFKVTATSDDDYVMAVEHASLPLCGVQFHPESIMTEGGLRILKNWIEGS